MVKIHKKPSYNFSRKGYSLIRKVLEDANESLSEFTKNDATNEELDMAEFTPNNATNNEKEVHQIELTTSTTVKRACQDGNLDRIKFLIETNQVDPNKPDEQNVYMLHWAAINNKLEIVKYLLEKGGSFSLKESFKKVYFIRN